MEKFLGIAVIVIAIVACVVVINDHTTWFNFLGVKGVAVH